MIPDNISREDVLSAIEEINNNGIPKNRHSDEYFLLYDNFLYPPKYVLTVANRFVNSKDLDSRLFSGGAESNEFLERTGFDVVRKPSVFSGQKWLVVTTAENWNICLQKGVWGGCDNRVNQMKRLKVGDHLLIYLVGMKIVAICKVVRDYYYDDTKIWNDGVYPHRVRIEPIKISKNTVDIKRVYDIYFKYKGAAGGYFGQAIRPLPDEEFSIFQSELARVMNELLKWDGIENPIQSNVEEKYFVLRWELDSKYQDKEGVYHFTTNVPRHAQIVPGVNVVFDRNVNGQIVFLGSGKVTEIKENKTGNNTSKGREIIDKLAYFENFEEFESPIPRNREVELLMQSIAGYNNQHSIRPITREIYDLILHNDGWNFDIDTVSEAILTTNPERELAISTETVKRIILHLKAGKHVILTGPPGVGKTELATRILDTVGRKITKSDHHPYLEAVASDEWSRNETIGGLNLNNEFKEGWITNSVNQKKWLLIDEFNRANMNKAFGEMFLAIEYNRITLRPQEAEQFKKSTIVIPKDFRMICTMNDFDKNLLLTELSYGLISRFAVVGIAPDEKKEEEVVEKRIKSELNDKTIYDKCKEQINTYYKFINKVRAKRLIGVRTSIDVIRFLVKGYDGNRGHDMNWQLLSYAFSDYILPQFDRLDREIIQHALEASDEYLQDSNFDSFKTELREANQRLEKATGWLLKKDE